MPDSDQNRSQTIATVERAADVLAAFANTPGSDLGVTEISNQLDLSKAVVHRILTSLRNKDLVRLDEHSRRYSLGPAALALGITYLRGIDVRESAKPVLRKLSSKTNETATLSVRVDNTRIYVDQVTPQREVKMTVRLGVPYPLHAGGSSKALLAHLSESEIDAYMSNELTPVTESTLVDPEVLRDQIADIRRHGYAQSFGERQNGAGSVAAPVFDHNGNPVAVISVCGPLERFRAEVTDIVPLLLDATQSLSSQLGWKPPR